MPAFEALQYRKGREMVVVQQPRALHLEVSRNGNNVSGASAFRWFLCIVIDSIQSVSPNDHIPERRRRRRISAYRAHDQAATRVQDTINVLLSELCDRIVRIAHIAEGRRPSKLGHDAKLRRRVVVSLTGRRDHHEVAVWLGHRNDHQRHHVESLCGGGNRSQ
mgnify:CR=1 FL=1